jgi:hypothetical protein
MNMFNYESKKVNAFLSKMISETSSKKEEEKKKKNIFKKIWHYMTGLDLVKKP